jgi:hypothetical protein
MRGRTASMFAVVEVTRGHEPTEPPPPRGLHVSVGTVFTFRCWHLAVGVWRAWVKSGGVVYDDLPRQPWCLGSADGVELRWQHLLRVGSGFVGDDASPGFGEGLGAHGAPGDGPLVVLFGEDGAHVANGRGAVGEAACDVGAATQLVGAPLWVVVGPDLAPVLVGKARDRGSSRRRAGRPRRPSGARLQWGTAAPTGRRPGRTGR